MRRCFLAACAVVALGATSAQAVNWSVDGSLADWLEAGLLKSDSNTDKASATAAVQMLRYGATVQNNMFYAVIELNRPVSDFDGQGLENGVLKNRKLYPGAFINVDRSKTTSLFDKDGTLDRVGTDINFEWGRQSDTPALNFWGATQTDAKEPGYGLKDLGAKVAGGVTGGLSADAGNVVEWACPVSSILGGLSSTNNATPGSVWSVVLGIQGTTRSEEYPDAPLGYTYGYDYSTLAGDANCDGTTDATDLNTVLSFYNQTDKNWATGDFNKDGTTDATDLNTVLSFYNRTNDIVVGSNLTLSSVPEPSSLAMVATLAALAGAWIMKRHRG